MLNVELDPESAKALETAKEFGATPSRFVRRAIVAHAARIQKAP